MFSFMVSEGMVPDDFNISLVKPIPKKISLENPSDYRPISISNVLCTLFEYLLLAKVSNICESSPTQFGYKRFTSCKSAFFAVNETINYYKSGKASIHVVSLDATKAFDKLWRAGLFWKLKDRIEPELWRVLYVYYMNSYIIVSIDNKRSAKFLTTQGVKQGGVLSPYLFNFFLDDLITQNNSMNIGALIGRVNMCTVAYCDDILLLSPVLSDMHRLLERVEKFARDWKLEFNPLKSVY